VLYLQPGQVINISLVDLSEMPGNSTTISGRRVSEVESGGQKNDCMEKYASISEPDTIFGTAASTCVCRTAARRAVVYSSKTNRVAVTLNTALPITTKFILVYTGMNNMDKKQCTCS